MQKENKKMKEYLESFKKFAKQNPDEAKKIAKEVLIETGVLDENGNSKEQIVTYGQYVNEKQEYVLILRDLVDIMSDPVTIEIDCEPVNNYIAEIHGFSTKLLFENVYLNENIIKEYLNNEVWSISRNHINIRNNDKTIYCDEDKKIETIKENGKAKEKNR